MAIGTPVQVGHNSSSATSNTLAATVANASATGDLLVALVDSSSPTITSVTDTQSNAYTPGVDVSFTGHSRAFYCPNAVALTGADTVTAHFGATGGTKSMTVISVPGIATTTPNDAAPAGVTSSPGTGTAPSIATGTLAQADEIVIGFVGVNTGNADTFTEASGFTANTSAGTGSSSVIHSAYQIVAATTTVTYAPTLGTARIFRANVLSFKAAGAGTITLGGIAATGSAGALSPTLALTPTGVTASGAAGSLGFGQALSGISATGSAGSLALVFSVALSGSSATGAAGSFVPTIPVALTGLQATGAAGSLSVSFAVALSGQAGTGSAGALGTGMGLSGIQASGSFGSFTPGFSLGLVGAQATGAAGGFVTGASLSGVSATGAIGTLGVTLSYQVALSGAQATAYLGRMLATGWSPATPTDETWSAVAPTSDPWTPVAPTVDPWTPVDDTDDPWTPVPPSSGWA